MYRWTRWHSDFFFFNDSFYFVIFPSVWVVPDGFCMKGVAAEIDMSLRLIDYWGLNLDAESRAVEIEWLTQLDGGFFCFVFCWQVQQLNWMYISSIWNEIQRSYTLYFMYSSNFMVQIDLSSVHKITKWLKFPKYWHDTWAVLKNFIVSWCKTL